MQHEYARCYSALDLPPGSEWSDIRFAYRKLVKKWHPDRFPEDVAARELAERKIKEITGSYRLLQEYYRAHGDTPLKAAPAIAASAASAAAATEQSFAPDRESVFESAASRQPAPLRSQHKTVLAGALIAAALLLVYLAPEEPSVPTAISTGTNGTVAVSQSGTVNTDEQTQQSGPQFSIGSTLGEVYSLQGVPSKIESDVWHYGKSRIYFTKGAVSSWHSHPENPLKARLTDLGTIVRQSFFSHGSTKSEVRAIQGTPTRETDVLWEFGTSRVRFKGDFVDGWHESPLYPLKVTK
jgi:hypothetical protein